MSPVFRQVSTYLVTCCQLYDFVYYQLFNNLIIASIFIHNEIHWPIFDPQRDDENFCQNHRKSKKRDKICTHTSLQVGTRFAHIKTYNWIFCQCHQYFAKMPPNFLKGCQVCDFFHYQFLSNLVTVSIFIPLTCVGRYLILKWPTDQIFWNIWHRLMFFLYSKTVQ